MYLRLIFIFISTITAKVTKVGLYGYPMPEVLTPTNGSATKAKYSIPVFVVYSGMFGSGTIVTEQLQVALDVVTDSGLLGDMELQLELFDTQCAVEVGPKMFLTYAENFHNSSNVTTKIPLILGPICAGADYIGTFLQHFGFVGITAMSTTAKLYKERGLYQNLFLLMPSSSGFYIALPRFIQANGWKRIFYISDGRDNFREFDDTFMEGCKKLNISIDSSYKFPYETGNYEASMDLIHEAVLDLKRQDARVIVFNTFWPVHVSCVLYHYKMFGPDYTFIQNGATSYGPDTPLKFFVNGITCTEEHLYQVLQSVIFYGVSINANVLPDRPDSFGITPREYERRMKGRMIDPETSPMWWLYRTSYYDMVTSAALVLKSVIEKKQNFTETNLKRAIESLNFKGNFFDISQGSWSIQYGRSAFYQVQSIDNVTHNESVSFADKLDYAPVAMFEPLVDELILGPRPLRWQTNDGSPPKDTLLILRKIEPVAPLSWSASLLTISIISSGLTLLCFYYHHGDELKVIILLGSLLMMLSVFVFMARSMANAETFRIYCMIGSALNILGVSLVVITFTIILKQMAARNGPPSGQKGPKWKSTQISTIPRAKQQSTTAVNGNSNGIKVTKIERLSIAFAAAIITTIAIVWFIVEPLKDEEINGPLVPDPVEISVRHQSYQVICKPGPKSIYFIAAILIVLALIALLASFFNTSIRPLQSDPSRNMVKFSWNMILIATIAGAIVTVSFFSYAIMLASAVVNILICSIVVAAFLSLKSVRNAAI